MIFLLEDLAVGKSKLVKRFLLDDYEERQKSTYALMMYQLNAKFEGKTQKIGTITPSQCRIRYQKFNLYALRGENGKSLPRAERNNAGRKKKNPQNDLPILSKKLTFLYFIKLSVQFQKLQLIKMFAKNTNYNQQQKYQIFQCLQALQFMKKIQYLFLNQNKNGLI